VSDRVGSWELGVVGGEWSMVDRYYCEPPAADKQQIKKNKI